MPGEDDAISRDPFRERLAAAGAATLGAVQAVEAALRRLDPEALPAADADLAGRIAELERVVAALRDGDAPEGLVGLRDDLAAAGAHALDALRGLAAARGPDAVPRVLGAMRAHARALERLYPLRRIFPPIGRHFAEPPLWDDLEALDPEPPPGASVGLHRAGGDADARGGFTLYVPERYTPERAWPLVVALHGAWGHGADFVWTWLREARSRGFLLLAPTSRGTTWSLDAPARDARALRAMLDFVAERWRVDRARLLLTGLSDGGTFALLAGLEEDAPWTALAPGACVLHPAAFAAGLGPSRGRRILWTHGARDWMFPVALARAACDALRDAGADVTLRVVEDLGHGWAREENDRILRWFDPSLGPDASLALREQHDAPLVDRLQTLA
ncbi:MAG: hypothetical protein R3263_02105, partial [Myxococcota bacterium]|nr:hypothetical protein [Myxococcota bacterium]